MKLISVLACAALLTIPLQAQRGGRGGFGNNAEVLDTLLKKYDKNKDGKIDRKEYPRGDTGFNNLDKDKNGVIEKADLEVRRQRGGRRRGGNRNRGDRPARPNIPEIGKVAPDFDLPLAEQKDKKKVVTAKLSSFIGKKPVALIFGSYT